MAFASEARRVASREMMATLENFFCAKDLLIASPRPGPEPMRRRVGVDMFVFGLSCRERSDSLVVID